MVSCSNPDIDPLLSKIKTSSILLFFSFFTCPFAQATKENNNKIPTIMFIFFIVTSYIYSSTPLKQYLIPFRIFPFYIPLVLILFHFYRKVKKKIGRASCRERV